MTLTGPVLRGARVVGYRLYVMNNAGHIREAAEFECADDRAALDYVADHLDGRAVELWNGARLVAKVSQVDPKAEQ